MSIAQNPSGTLLLARTGDEVAAGIEQLYKLLLSLVIAHAEGLKWYEDSEIANVASTAVHLHQTLLTAKKCALSIDEKVETAAWGALNAVVHGELVDARKDRQAKGHDASFLDAYFAFIATHPLPDIPAPEAP